MEYIKLIHNRFSSDEVIEETVKMKTEGVQDLNKLADTIDNVANKVDKVNNKEVKLKVIKPTKNTYAGFTDVQKKNAKEMVSQTNKMRKELSKLSFDKFAPTDLADKLKSMDLKSPLANLKSEATPTNRFNAIKAEYTQTETVFNATKKSMLATEQKYNNQVAKMEMAREKELAKAQAQSVKEDLFTQQLERRAETASKLQPILDNLVKKQEELSKSDFKSSNFGDKLKLLDLKFETKGFTGKPEETVNKLGTAFQYAAEKEKLLNKEEEQQIKNQDALNAKVDASTNSFSKFISSITGMAVKFRIMKGLLTGIVSTFMKVYNTSADYEEALNLYTVALGKYADRGSQWANKISSALYLDPKNIYQYEGALYNLVRGLGAGSEAAYKMSTNLTQLTYDMSSYLNIDIDTAYSKIQSAMTGQSRAVASAGVAMQQASLQQLVYSLGLKKNVSDMTQAEKTYLRYIQIMNQTKNMQGDLARTLATPQNSIRLLKQQFTLLAREVGNVFIPIMLKIIPTMIAVVQVIGEAISAIAKFFGINYKPVQIDYSSVSGYSDAVSDGLDDIGKSADGTKNKLEGMLAPFDELNVVANRKTGSGSGSGGDTSSILGDLEKYITGYDMLAGYSDKMSKAIEDAKNNIKKLLPFIETALGLWGAFKLAKGISNIKALFSNLTNGSGILNTLGKSLGFIGANGEIMFGKLTASTALLVAAFFTLKQAISDENEMLTELEQSQYTYNDAVHTSMGNMAAADMATAMLVGAAINPVVGLTTAIALMGKQIYDVYTEAKKYTDDYIATNYYLGLQFERTGASIDILANAFSDTFGPMDEYSNKTKNLNEQLEINKQDAKEATHELQNLIFEITNGINADSNGFKNLHDALINARDAIKKVNDAEVERFRNSQEHLLKEGIITKEEYERNTGLVADFYKESNRGVDEYYTKLDELDRQLSTNKITTEEYRVKVGELNEQYKDIIESQYNSASSLQTLFDTTIGNIDLSGKSAEELQGILDNINNTYNTYKDNAKKAYDEDKKNNDERIRALSELRSQVDMTTDKGREEAEKYQQMIDLYKTANENNLASYKTNSEQLASTYKDIMLTIYGEMRNAGDYSTGEFKTVVDGINDILTNQLGDVDLSKSVTNYYGRWSYEMKEKSKSAIPEVLNDFVKSWNTEQSEAITRYTTTTTTSMTAAGVAVIDGFNKGLTNSNSINKVAINAKNIADTTDKTIRSGLDIHSPSRVTEQLGMYTTEGFANGLVNSSAMNQLNTSLNSIKSQISNALSSVNVNSSINISTNVENSFNTLLNKLSRFCNAWKNGINNLMTNMNNTINSIKIGSNGKLSFTKMPSLKIEQFATGGFPTSGDLFFANENGNAEFITSIGQKTAVANQDQMVSALTNAILTGMRNIKTPNSERGDTIVYIGNDKVYQGQGQYQSRQNDRYGTSVVKI